MENPTELPAVGEEALERIETQAIRGPLAWIIASLDALEADAASQLSPAAKKALGDARGASKRLLDMLESLLAARRMTAGREPADDHPVGLTAALEPVVKALSGRAQAEGKSFTWKSDTPGLAAAANEDLLRRAVRLVSNRGLDEAQRGGQVRAVATASGPGAVRIRISATPPAEDSGQVGQVVPAELGFARMAVEQMGGKFVMMREADQGLIVDLVLHTPGAHPVPASPPAPPPAAVPPPHPVEDKAAAPPQEVAAPAPRPAPPAAEAPAKPIVILPDLSSAHVPGPEHAPAHHPEEPPPPASESGFRIVREVTFDWNSDK